MTNIAAGSLANAPVVFALAAIRYESLELLPNWIGDIQEELRDQLPLFRRVRQTIGNQAFQLTLDPPDFDGNDPGSSWVMSTLDGKTSVQFSKSSLIVHTKEYSTFKNFAHHVGAALTALIKYAKRLNTSQIGIRYIDHIRVMNGMGIDRFVPDRLMPHVPDVEGLEIRGGVSVTTFGRGSDLLNVRFSSGNGMPVIPEDLIGLYLSNTRPEQGGAFTFPSLKPQEGVLDTDCIAPDLGGVVLSPEEIHNVLDRLHATANAYFRAVTTQEAADAWHGSNREAV